MFREPLLDARFPGPMGLKKYMISTRYGSSSDCGIIAGAGTLTDGPKTAHEDHAANDGPDRANNPSPERIILACVLPARLYPLHKVPWACQLRRGTCIWCCPRFPSRHVTDERCRGGIPPSYSLLQREPPWVITPKRCPETPAPVHPCFPREIFSEN